jgi:hypothetical protein
MHTHLEQLRQLWQYIRDHGVKRQVQPGMGGIWSADTWDYIGFMAQQADDGVTLSIGDVAGVIGWSTYGRDVEYWSGRDADDLAAMYKHFFPEAK